MKKRLLSYVLAVIMVFCTLNTFVYAATVDYLPGLIEYYQELDNPSSTTNATCSASGATINAGGNVKYDFILPFDAATLDITYKASANTTLTLTTPRNTYSATLASSSTTHQVALTPEHLGVTSMTIASTGAVTISQLKYTKIKEPRDDSSYFDSVVEYTEYQELLKTAVIVSEKSSAIKTKNLTRYINFEDTSETTTIVDGKMYLPIGTFARAFGLYYEDYADLMYAYISGDDFSIYLKAGSSYYETKGITNSFTDVAVYKNGVTYVPVRELAEMIGYTVYYRDGLAVIDNKISANEILNNYDVFEELKAELKAYEPVFNEENPGKVYHVAQTPEASDLAYGTEAAPFATIQKAADVARAGDTVIIHEGVYRESVKVNHDGTAAKPIIFKAAEGEDVTLSAFKTVSGFSSYTNPANNVSMYVADLSDLAFEASLPGAWDVDRNFVLYNNDVLAEGRHPNGKTSTAKTVTRKNEGLDATANPSQTESFTYVVTPDHNPSYPDINNHKLLPTQGDMRIRDVLAKGSLKTYNHTLYSEVDLNQDTADYWKGATYIGRVGMAWNLSAGLVTASKKNEATVSEKCISSIPVGTITYYQAKEAEDYGFLTHHLNTVDKAGEWYIDVDSKKMYVIPPSGANASTMKFEVKERQVLFDMRGRQYVQLHNVNTSGGGITMAECTGCVLNGGTHKYISQLDLSSAHCLQDFSNIYARYDTIKDGYKFGDDGKNFKKTNLLGETGLVTSGHYNAIVNTDIEYSAAGGIDVLGSYNYIDNNYVSKTGYGVSYRSGITYGGGALDEGFPAGGHQIYQNTITGSGRHSMGGGGTDLAPVDIAYNDIGWANTGATDSGVFYFYGTVGGTDLTKSTIHHNMMHDNVTSDIGSTMQTVFYSDGYTTLSDVYDNIFYLSSNDPTYIMEDGFTSYRALEFWHGDNTSIVVQRHWGNVHKIFESPDKVKFDITDYPNGYPFYAGAIRDNQSRFMMNYERHRDTKVFTFANHGLNWGSYKTDDNLVMLPQASSTIRVDNVTLGQSGTRIDIYYSGDFYTKDMTKLPTVSLEFINSSNATVGTVVKPLKNYSDYADVLSHISIYAPTKYKDCTSVRLSTTSRDIGFAKMVLNPIDLAAENAKVDVPLEADKILLGSADYHSNTHPTWSLYTGSSREWFAIDKDRYYAMSNTYTNGARYNNRVISNTCTKVTIDAASNGSHQGNVASIYIGTSEYGEKIAEIDCSSLWTSGEPWSPKTKTVNLYRTLAPGTYNFFVKWSSSKWGATMTGNYIAFH